MKEAGLVIADITAEGQTFVAAKGGLGGIGNAYFKTAVNQTPDMATEGTPGEEKAVELELKTIADIGLVSISLHYGYKSMQVEFIKGWVPGKLTCCENDCACLV